MILPAPFTDTRPPEEDIEVIDFHCHYAGPGLRVDASRGTPPGQKEFWTSVTQRLSSPEELAAATRASGARCRLISTPLEFLAEPEETVKLDDIKQINDSLAELSAKSPGALYGLATVDAFAGESSAIELVRAVKELGLRGVFIESARAGMLPDVAQARPTFHAAAELNVPVFLHPVPERQLRRKFGPSGKYTERLSRSAINSAALFAMIEAGIFEELPDLHVVVTGVALGGLMVGECMADGARIGKEAVNRRHVYIDTTGMHPVMIRASVDLLGADHVVMGTDWPVAVELDLQSRLRDLFDVCGFSAAERKKIAGANAKKLLRL